MPATPQITFTNERHSFVSERSAEKCDAPKHIPRPPNAFMLYRSNFLKSRVIPPEVEKRQQNLSRIAGQCWKGLSETEKAIWFNKAAIIRAEHRAKYPFYKIGQAHKDTSRLSAKEKRGGSTSKSAHPLGRSRRRRMRTPYCEGMFAALHNPRLSSPESKASLLFPAPSESPVSTTASLSPIALPHLLSSFASPTQSIRQESPSATFDNSVIRGGNVDSLLDSSGPEIPSWNLSWISPIDIGSSTKPNLALPQYDDDLASCVPSSGLEQLFVPWNNPDTPVPLTLPGPSIFSPSAFPLADCHSLSNGLKVADYLAPFSQSLALA